MENEQVDAGRDGRTGLARPNSQARTGTGEILFFSVQLTTTRIGNLIRLIHALLYVMTTYTFSLNMEMTRLTRDGTAETVSQDQILRHESGRGKNHFPCSADHEQDWQPYPVDPYYCYMRDHTYIHAYMHTVSGIGFYIIFTLNIVSWKNRLNTRKQA